MTFNYCILECKPPAHSHGPEFQWKDTVVFSLILDTSLFYYFFLRHKLYLIVLAFMSGTSFLKI